MLLNKSVNMNHNRSSQSISAVSWPGGTNSRPYKRSGGAGAAAEKDDVREDGLRAGGPCNLNTTTSMQTTCNMALAPTIHPFPKTAHPYRHAKTVTHNTLTSPFPRTPSHKPGCVGSPPSPPPSHTHIPNLDPPPPHTHTHTPAAVPGIHQSRSAHPRWCQHAATC
mgnify:CR=1 FL=1